MEEKILGEDGEIVKISIHNIIRVGAMALVFGIALNFAGKGIGMLPVPGASLVSSSIATVEKLGSGF